MKYATVMLLVACALTTDAAEKELELSAKYHGYLHVDSLSALPENQRKNSQGYINDEKTFKAVSDEVFPDVKLPAIDFMTSIVIWRVGPKVPLTKLEIHSINLDKDGKASIGVLLTDGISNSVLRSIAMAVAPRDGINKIEIATDKTIDVTTPSK